MITSLEQLAQRRNEGWSTGHVMDQIIKRYIVEGDDSRTHADVTDAEISAVYGGLTSMTPAEIEAVRAHHRTALEKLTKPASHKLHNAIDAGYPHWLREGFNELVGKYTYHNEIVHSCNVLLKASNHE